MFGLSCVKSLCYPSSIVVKNIASMSVEPGVSDLRMVKTNSLVVNSVNRNAARQMLERDADGQTAHLTASHP